MRLTILVVLGLFAASPAFAAATTAPLPQPDPSAATLTPREIGDRAFNGCLVIQSRLQNAPREQLNAPCNCYSKRTLARMTRGEIASFRQTGYFDDSSRAKALEALDYCKLPRPI